MLLLVTVSVFMTASGTQVDKDVLQAALTRAAAFEARFDNVRIIASAGNNSPQPADGHYSGCTITLTVLGKQARADIEYPGKDSRVLDTRCEILDDEHYFQWNYSKGDPDGTAVVERPSANTDIVNARMYQPILRTLGLGRRPVEQVEGVVDIRLIASSRPDAKIYADCEMQDGNIRVLETWSEYKENDQDKPRDGTHYKYEYGIDSVGESFQIPARVRQVYTLLDVDSYYDVQKVEFKPTIPKDFFQIAVRPGTWVSDKISGTMIQNYSLPAHTVASSESSTTKPQSTGL